MKVSKQTSYLLEVTEAEAYFLKLLTQNPVEGEPAEMTVIRQKIFEALPEFRDLIGEPK